MIDAYVERYFGQAGQQRATYLGPTVEGDKLLAQYPEEYSSPSPSADHRWDGTAWVYVAPDHAPDYRGFLVYLDANLTSAQINEMHRLYGMFVSWCQFENADRIQECILDAQANHPTLMTPAVCALFRQAVMDSHIPVVLP